MNFLGLQTSYGIFLAIWHFGRNHYFFHKVQNTCGQEVLELEYAVFVFWRFLWSNLIGLTYLYLFSADKQFDMSTKNLAQQRHYLDSTSIYFIMERWLIKNYRGGEFTGIIDCWRSTVRNHGFLALYAGMVPNLVGEVVYRGLKYCLYDFIQVMKIYLI